MAPGISFGHFNIVGGSVREDGPYVGVVEDRTPAECLADLFLVIEATQPDGVALCPDILRLIEGQFGRPQYSLTGNLLQALRAAQEHLRSWNKAEPPNRQAALGATCLTISGDEAYLAQVGPALAYLRHDGLLRKLQPIEEEAQAPLGTSIGCSPEFRRFELSQGDSILLISSRFAELVDDQTADLILSMPPSDALPEIFKRARNEAEFSALYLAVTGELRPAVLDDTLDGRQLSRSPGRTRAHPADDYAAPSTLAFDEPESGPPGPLAEQFAVGNLKSDRGPKRSWFRRRRDFERLTGHPGLTLPRPAMYMVGGAIALTVVGWFGLPQLLAAGRQDRFAVLIRDAQDKESTAASAPDPGQARTLIEKAQADLAEARTLRSQSPDLAKLDAEALRGLQALDQVRTLQAITTLADLTSTPIASRSVTDMVAGSRLYVLDGSTGKVYSFDPARQSQSPMPAFEEGKVVESIPTGKAVHLALQPGSAGQSGLLYILDANRRLFSLDDSGTLRACGLAGAADWKNATSLTINAGSLFVLDSSGNQIWRFAPTEAGFSGAPAPLLTKADLHDAAQISVVTDPYISTVNGRLFRYRDGHPEAVTLKGIDHPLVAPQPPIFDQASGLSLFADPGNQRIVVADGGAVFRYQYAGSALQGLRAIALDQNAGLLYALIGQKLVSAPIR